MVLEHYYGGSYNVNVLYRRVLPALNVRGPPVSCKYIEQVSTGIRKIAIQIRKKLFNGTLTINVDDDQKPHPLEKFCTVHQYRWTRESLKIIELVGFAGEWGRRISMTVIKLITSQFPLMQTVSLTHVKEKDAYDDESGRGYQRQTASFNAVQSNSYKKAFLDGSRDVKYDSPVRKFEAQFLAKALEVHGMHHVKVFVTWSIWWMGLGRGLLLRVVSNFLSLLYPRAPIRMGIQANISQGVCFRVTPDRRTATDRDWRRKRDFDRSRGRYARNNHFDWSMEIAREEERQNKLWIADNYHD